MKKYNILWLFSDQHRTHAMGCMGDINVKTPNIDKLAEEGVLFSNTYSISPLCAPFRASLYTGKMINEHGVNSLHKPPKHELKMLPELMQEQGYYTMHCGKWHLSGGAAPCHYVSPYFRPGWDEWVGWENSNRPFNTEYSVGIYPYKKTFEGYQTDCVTNQVLTWIGEREDKQQPWFTVMSVEPPHDPHLAPQEYMDRMENVEIKFRENVPSEWKTEENIKMTKGYYAQILNLDDNIGRIIQKLKDTNQYENTIIMYFSDHGEFMGSFGRHGKYYAENESSKIPFIVRHPEQKYRGIVNNDIISSLDITKTTMSFAGIEDSEEFRGDSLFDSICKGIKNDNKTVIVELDSWFMDSDLEYCYRCLVNEEYMYVLSPEKRNCRLYKNQDEFQLNNLYEDDAYFDVKQIMKETLKNKLDECNDNFFEMFNLN